MVLLRVAKMATFGVKRASDDNICHQTVQSSIGNRLKLDKVFLAVL